MESSEPVFNETPVKKNQTPLIIAAVALVLGCCCVILAVAGFYSFTAIRSMETQTQPLEDVTPEVQPPSTENDYESPGVDTGIGEAPAGGLGNDVLLNDTWQYVAFSAMGQGCDQPLGAETEIEVLQEPSNGVWVEKWTVACASGDRYPYEVEYILDDTGATFNIKPLP